MRLNFHGTLRRIVGSRSIQIDHDQAISAENLLEMLIDLYPTLRPELLNDKDEPHGHIQIIVNGEDSLFHSWESDQTIGPDDKLDIFPAMGGGVGAEYSVWRVSAGQTSVT